MTTNDDFDYIAERNFSVDGEDRAIVISIGHPSQDPVDAHVWRCPFRVSGIHDDVRMAYGVDALQALMMAIEGSRAVLAASGCAVSWFAGECPGDTGIPRIAPPLPREFRESIERCIDEQLQLWAQAAQRKGAQ